MIKNAIIRAYKTARARKWDKIYWAIDLHETCLRSNYGKGSYQFLGQYVINCLQMLSRRPETVIILWSSVHADEEKDIIDFFAQHGIHVSYFNHNPEVSNTATGNFDTKFYFNILLDDKAGFDHETDWYTIFDLFDNADFNEKKFGTYNFYKLPQVTEA